jgi:hypothetical protein
MFSVNKIPRPRNTNEPVHAMYARLSAELQQLEPGHPVLNQMFNGGVSVDAVEDALDRVKAARLAATEPSDELRKVWNELYELEKSFNTRAHELKKAQAWLWRSRGDWRHQLLRNLKPEMFVSPEPYDSTHRYAKKYPDVFSTRKAAREVFAKLQELESLTNLVGNVQAFDTLEPGDQAVHLCHALYDENIELRTRLTAAEAAIATLQAEVSKLKTPKIRKAKA